MKEKVKTKVIYRNREAEKRSKAFDKRIHEEGERKKKKDPISEAHKESSKSPRSMFKHSMKELQRMSKKK